MRLKPISDSIKREPPIIKALHSLHDALSDILETVYDAQMSLALRKRGVTACLAANKLEADHVAYAVLDAQDLAQILVALRYWQMKYPNGDECPAQLNDHFEGTDGPIDADAIDELCETINCANVILFEGGETERQSPRTQTKRR